MPGLYLVLRDTEGKTLDEVLRVTQGGPPHVTVAYTGKRLGDGELIRAGMVALGSVVRKSIVLQSVSVNTFFHEKMGCHRHDVLLGIDPELIVNLRKQLFDGVKDIIMRKPHVTVGTFALRAEADAEAKRISTLLPRSVSIVGFFI